MPCSKCGYESPKNKVLKGFEFCLVCSKFVPIDGSMVQSYVSEKLDWKSIEPFRKYNSSVKTEKMKEVARKGRLVSRAPLGYRNLHGVLISDEDAVRVRAIFKAFLEEDSNFISLSRRFGLSINGLKKVLSNRTYLGEIKFAGEIFKGNHKPLISPEIFYAVQRKLKEKSRKKSPGFE